MEDVFDTLRAATVRISKMPATTDFGSLSAGQVKAFVGLAGELRQAVERVLACGSAEINRRSQAEFGGAGLAKASGFVNSEALIAVLTGTSHGEARKIDRLGKTLMQATSNLRGPAAGAGDTEPDDGDGTHNSNVETDTAGSTRAARPWFAVLTDAMLAGQISPDRCEAVRAGFGDTTETVTDGILVAAASELLELLHPDDSPETAHRDARQARAFLDRESVLKNEIAQQAKQEAKVWTSRDGMVHLRADFAPEDGTWVKNTLDLLLGPRIGGPRFTGPQAQRQLVPTGPDRALEHTHPEIAAHPATNALTDDPRSTEQIRAAMLIDLLKAGVNTDDNAILARKRPTVQIIVSGTELTRPETDGVAFIEGSRYPVSRRTVNRLICDSGYTPVITDPTTGTPLDLGRDVRLFTPSQRTALATLQGGCVWNGCSKPPVMCEAHHIDPWATGGKTDINDGVLLCRTHHLQLHNHGWRITRTKAPTGFDSTGHHDITGPYDTEVPQHGDRTLNGEQKKQAGPQPRRPRPFATHYENSYWLTPPVSQDPRQTPIKLRFRATTHPLGHTSDRAAGAASGQNR